MSHGNLGKLTNVFEFKLYFLSGFYRKFPLIKLHGVVTCDGNFLGGVGGYGNRRNCEVAYELDHIPMSIHKNVADKSVSQNSSRRKPKKGFLKEFT